MQRRPLVKALQNHSLSIVALILFALFMGGQSLTGWRTFNEEQREHGEPRISFGRYLGSGHFWEATSENWESEFLQMGAFMLMSALLMQRGSSQSKKEEAEDEVPVTGESPWPVKRGGLVRRLYEHSLSITFGLLFLMSFAIHAVSGLARHNQEAIMHGQPASSLISFLGSSELWFQSFQNWQSEFMSVAALVLLSIYLREKGSPESKPVAASHAHTGA
jgi:uncharacterized protein DUF6766